MTHLSIAACLGEDFLAQALHREHRHVPGALDVAGLMTWDDLNHIQDVQGIRITRAALSLYAGRTLTRENAPGYMREMSARLQELRPLLHAGSDHLIDGEGGDSSRRGRARGSS
ncbi:hypothetical protein [Streptomyces sp. NPDC002559]